MPVKPWTIITPEQFAELYEAIPDAQSRLLVETAIETGLRWGGADRAVGSRHRFRHPDADRQPGCGERDARFHPQCGRFLVKEYPKDREYRRLKLSTQIAAKLKARVTEHGRGRDDLIFQAAPIDEPRIRKLRLVADPDALGYKRPDER